MKWNNYKSDIIGGIEKCVAEFNIYETQLIPYSKFKVKIFERQNGKYIGYTDLQVKDSTGSSYCGVGFGNSIDEALEDTINYFMEMLKEKDVIMESDFSYLDYTEF